MQNIKVRFHLSNGPQWGHWQIKRKDRVDFYHPNEVCLVLKDAVLKNRRATAEGIFSGKSKSVCSWIYCETIDIKPRGDHNESANSIISERSELIYNPKIAPYWRDSEGINLDNRAYGLIISEGKKLYV